VIAPRALLARLLSSLAVALGCWYAAHISLLLALVLGATTYGVLTFMAKVHDPAFQARFEERLGQRGPSHRERDD
jgi:hypothetical protein